MSAARPMTEARRRATYERQNPGRALTAAQARQIRKAARKRAAWANRQRRTRRRGRRST